MNETHFRLFVVVAVVVIVLDLLSGWFVVQNLIGGGLK